MRRNDATNRFKDLPEEQLARWCEHYSNEIRDSPKHNARSEQIAQLLDAARDALLSIGPQPEELDDNPFTKLSRDELAAACMRQAGQLQERQQRTQLGDTVAYLLIATAWALDPPSAPNVSGPLFRGQAR